MIAGSYRDSVPCDLHFAISGNDVIELIEGSHLRIAGTVRVDAFARSWWNGVCQKKRRLCEFALPEEEFDIDDTFPLVELCIVNGVDIFFVNRESGRHAWRA
jgi:hypothetical protein